jgi:hypothetical protein
LIGMGYVIAKFQILDGRAQRRLAVAVAVMGWLVVALAAARFLKRRQAIEQADFGLTVGSDVCLVLLAALAGLAVLTYLWRS